MLYFIEFKFGTCIIEHYPTSIDLGLIVFFIGVQKKNSYTLQPMELEVC